MSQRNVQKLEKPAVKRTLRRFWRSRAWCLARAFLAVFTSRRLRGAAHLREHLGDGPHQ
ncbi:MAG: hypothetical protein ACLTSX_02085 [Collinsella sp.]